MVNPIQAIKLGVKLATRSAVDKGISGKTVNPIYKNGGAPPIGSNPVKINSNPNKTPAKSMKISPTESALREAEQNDALRKMYYNLPKNEMTKDTIKINSNRRSR
jgi:hypothetical protein